MQRSLRALSLFLFGSLILASPFVSAVDQTRAASAPPRTSGKRTVCTITVNSDDEKKAFRAKLSPQDFEFKELTDVGRVPGQPNTDWFQKACEQKISCDVLIVSGHFAGSFYGSAQEEWGLDEMERMSCKSSCDGILKQPKETFLFGCNTLATKEADARTFDQYVALQQDPDHGGLDHATATRNAQARYSALGASFKERMQRVFAGVPRLYGFDSVGPLGATVKPSLDAYLAKVPNYRDYLDRIKKGEVQQVVDKFDLVRAATTDINQTAQADQNSELARAMRRFNFTQCSGVMPGTAEGAVRAEICRLYSPTLSWADKARSAAEMLKKSNRLSYLPSVFAFLKENQDDLNRDPEARAILRSLIPHAALWADLDKMLYDPKESPYTKLDVLRLKYAIGKIDKETFEAQIKQVLAGELRNLDNRAVMILQTLRREHGIRVPISSAEIDMKKLETNNGVSAFTSLRSDDPKITAKVLSTFSVMREPQAVTFGLEALMGLPGNNALRAEAASRFIGNPNPQINAMAHLLKASTTADAGERYQLMLDLTKLPNHAQIAAYEALNSSGIKNEELAFELIDTLGEGKIDSYHSRLQLIARITPAESKVWKEVTDLLDADGPQAAASAAAHLRDLPQPPASLMPWAFGKMQSDPQRRGYFSALLAKTDLTQTQVSQLADQLVSTNDPGLQKSLRYVLRAQRDAQFTPDQRRALEGPYSDVSCQHGRVQYDCTEITR